MYLYNNFYETLITQPPVYNVVSTLSLHKTYLWTRCIKVMMSLIFWDSSAINLAKSLGSTGKKISERNTGDLTSSVPLRTNICHLDSKVKGLQRVCL